MTLRPGVKTLLCGVLLSTCAAQKQKTASVGDDSEALCWWSNAKWYARTPVSLPGLKAPIGNLFGNPKQPLTLKASLRKLTDGHVEMQGRFTNANVNVLARIDATDHSLLHLIAPQSAGQWLHMAPETAVRAIGGNRGVVSVTLEPWVLKRFDTAQPLTFEKRCAELTINPPRFVFPKNGQRVPAPKYIEAQGFKSDAPWFSFVEPQKIPLSESVSGAPVATVEFSSGYYQLETQGDWQRIAATLDHRVYVMGWAPQQWLAAVKPPGAGGGGLSGINMGKKAALQRRICSTTLALGIRRDGSVHPWGMLSANSSFTQNAEPTGGWVSVSVSDFDFLPAKDTELVLPEVAATCTPVAAEPAPANLFGANPDAGLSDVLGPAELLQNVPPPQP